MDTENMKVPFQGWSIVREIGHGGYGKVYEIRRHLLDTDERSAMKVIPVPRDPAEIRDYLNDGYDLNSLKKRYAYSRNAVLREYTIMAKMKDSVNIVRCEDITAVINPDGISSRIFIRMELLTPIREYEKLQIYDENEVIRLGMDMCSILSVCEKEGIIHRDIKPANIMVSARGDYKLGDFGVARMMDHTTVGTRIGTVNYMAPEVYFGGKYGHTADIYSLGLVLYGLMNNRRMPFLPPENEGSNINDEFEAQQKRMSGLPIPRPCCGSSRLANIVLKALAFSPQDRFRTAEEFKTALYQCRQDQDEKTSSYEDTDQQKVTEQVPPDVQLKRQDEEDKNSKAGIFLILSGIAAVVAAMCLFVFIFHDIIFPDDGTDSGSSGSLPVMAASSEAAASSETAAPSPAEKTSSENIVVTVTPAATEKPADQEPVTVETQYGVMGYGSDLLPTQNEVNVRSEPSHYSDLVFTFNPMPHGKSSGLIFKGQKAEGYGSDNMLHTWYFVGAPSDTQHDGWVRSDLVRLPAYDNGPWHIYYDRNDSGRKICVPNDPVNGLNVRSKSTHESELVDTIYGGVKLYFYDEISQGYGSDGILHDWYRVEWIVTGTTEEKAGWIRSDLVTIKVE